VFHDKMHALTLQLAEACALAGEAMAEATEALVRADREKAEDVITGHQQIMAATAHATESAFALLALQAPVAGDLRVIVGGIQIAADVERMGALAAHVAKVVRRRHPGHAVPDHVNLDFAEMGRVAVELANAARSVLLDPDPVIAARIDVEDDTMDNLHRHLFTVLLDHDWPHGVATAVDITLLGRYYERFADHAVEVGRRVIFQATGQHPSPA
jgi:phosphate transport system protein